MNAPPSRLKSSQHFGIKPCELFNGLPGKQLVIARRNRRDIEPAIRIRDSRPVKIRAMPAPLRNHDHTHSGEHLRSNVAYDATKPSSSNHDDNIHFTPARKREA